LNGSDRLERCLKKPEYRYRDPGDSNGYIYHEADDGNRLTFPPVRRARLWTEYRPGFPPSGYACLIRPWFGGRTERSETARCRRYV
jgi:hypothetical protein